jgi:lipopolysaccharide export system protein LptA
MNAFGPCHRMQRLFALAVLVCLMPAVGNGQSASGPPNALQGFSQNRNQPIKIDAASLEVRDKDKVATFHGNVHLVQGDTILRCSTLVVFYDQGTAVGAVKTTQPNSGKIRRLEAKGGVTVSQKEQTATGDTGEFDMQANTVTLIGNVVISQGPNVIKGDRLVVDMTSGTSRVECGRSTQCRVQALIQPREGAKGVSKGKGEGEGSKDDTASTQKGTPRARPQQQPSGLY